MIMTNNAILGRLLSVSTFIPFLFILTGCPGVGDRVPPRRAIPVTKDRICFSVNKNDVVNFYKISSVQQDVYKVFAAKGNVTLSGSDSCLNLSLPPGYSYAVKYALNNQYYTYGFFIDNDGNIHLHKKG